MKRIAILGVPVDVVTEEEAVQWVRKALLDDRPKQIATVNPEFVMRARRDEAFKSVLERADLCLPDGAGLLWASRRLGRPIPQRVAGVDLVRSLARAGAREGWKFFFLGSREGVAQAAARVLQDENPGLQVVGSLAGGPGPEWDERSTAAVRASGAQVLLVAYGAPAQDMWISRNLKSSGARVAMGVGGAFDFISGRSRRAPNWMRQRGLEWLHRLGREPWRWRRMLALPAFVVEVSKQVRQKNAPARP